MINDRMSDRPREYRRHSAWLGGFLHFPSGWRFKAGSLRNRLWIRADRQLASLVDALRTRGASDLRGLLEAPHRDEVREGRLVVRITAHAHVERSGALAVIVEARQSRWAGFAHTLSADGFYLLSDGSIAPMKEEDLWNHGY